MRLLKIFILSIGIFFGNSVLAQVSIQFLPEIYGRSLDGLMHVNLLNAGRSFNARLRINIQEKKSGKILSLQTNAFQVMSGNNQIPVAAIRSANLQFGANTVANFIQKNGYFPEGNYDYDFQIIAASSSDQQIIIDQNFNQQIVPLAPMDLIEPYNKDEICDKRPLLTWQPLMPAVNGAVYSLLMVEVKSNQNAVEALNYNLPIVNQKGIPANILIFPSNARELVQDKQYAWQVTAYKDQTVINRSDVWTFKVSCKDSISNVLEKDNGYRDIEDLVKGNYYVSNGEIRFSLINSYNEQNLKYSIICINDPSKKIRNLPHLKLKRGQNKIKIDLSRNFSFDDHYSYILKIQMPDGSLKSLRFLYKQIIE